ncbi:hypothetical protein [Mucilaginibacter kameinonensis]|uniref:hypothetical protein n=1 Tax=Mucilaginibacter kameinonensis TaxID=452286 RepID=UPI0013CE5B1E|nr:hypothetical protein [Mucilaginibacter kameinonensis]
MTISKRTTLRIIIGCLILNCFAGVSAKSRLFQVDPFAILKGCKCIRSLKGKSGEMLGYIYVKENNEYTNVVLTTLLVVKENGHKLDTLYRIDSKGFFNSRGKAELKNEVKGYHGFKLAKELKKHTDLFSIGFTDRNGKAYSDDNDFLIIWDYKKKAFEYYPAP